MKKVNNVLIAVDYGPTAEVIAEKGYAFAGSLHANSLSLLHVVADPAYYSSMEYSPIMGFSGFNVVDVQNAEKELTKSARLFLQKVKAHLADESIDIIVKEGDAADLIIKTAKEIKADVIIMGSHSHRWLEKILMGSVTKEVLGTSSIPLYIIPTGKK